MATKKSNVMKATIWTENVKMDISGTILACVLEGFGHIMPGMTGGKEASAADMRELALKIMTTHHEKLKADGR